MKTLIIAALLLASATAAQAQQPIAWRTVTHPLPDGRASLFIQTPNASLHSPALTPSVGAQWLWASRDIEFAAAVSDWTNGQPDVTLLGLGESSVEILERDWTHVAVQGDWVGRAIQFATAEVTSLLPNSQAQVRYTIYVPEPSGVALALLAPLALSWRWKR